MVRCEKPKLMITYYEKLTRIFAVADNKLFHAYSWLKFYQWSLEGRKDIKQEEFSFSESDETIHGKHIGELTETECQVYLKECLENEWYEKANMIKKQMEKFR